MAVYRRTSADAPRAESIKPVLTKSNEAGMRCVQEAYLNSKSEMAYVRYSFLLKTRYLYLSVSDDNRCCMTEETTSSTKSDFSGIVATIVSAYVSNNSLPVAELPDLMASVHSAISKLLGQAIPKTVIAAPLEPAVPIKKSVMHDFMICLEDGKKYKSLKRHLMSAYGLSPDAYRAKWGLPNNYPMVAPGYAATRSQLAKQIGLGKKGESSKASPTPAGKAVRQPRKKAA